MPREPVQFVYCKTLGHAWDVNPHTLRRTSMGNMTALLCGRCTTERIDTYAFHSFDLVQRRYHYPEGYKYAKKLTRAELRQEMFRQMRAERKFSQALDG